jgi:hypothetical protein
LPIFCDGRHKREMSLSHEGPSSASVLRELRCEWEPKTAAKRLCCGGCGEVTPHSTYRYALLHLNKTKDKNHTHSHVSFRTRFRVVPRGGHKSCLVRFSVTPSHRSSTPSPNKFLGRRDPNFSRFFSSHLARSCPSIFTFHFSHPFSLLFAFCEIDFERDSDY